MNWKSEAMEKLRRYDAMQQASHNLPAEIRRLQIAARVAKSANLESVPGKGGEARREEELMNNMVHRQELQWSLDQTKCWLEATERALRVLNPEEKLILQRLYIYPERGAVERLCQELELEQSSIYRRRDRALQRFAIALYGFPES